MEESAAARPTSSSLGACLQWDLIGTVPGSKHMKKNGRLVTCCKGDINYHL